jgi:hypothetical protein
VSDHGHPEPFDVAQMVEEYVSKAHHDAEQYTNSELLDASGVYSLHRLAAAIYAKGWQDGHVTGSDAQRRERQREKDREREEAPR